MTENALPLPRLAPRAPGSHKGDFGRALLIGGSREMSGAISLTGAACLRSGAGLVQVATAASAQPIVAAHNPCYTTIALAEDDTGRILLRAADRIFETAEKATALGCGPGMGQSEDVKKLCERLYREIPQPLVCDADMLNALARRAKSLNRPGGPRVLTPHPGEFQRLAGVEQKMERCEMEARAKDLAAQWGVVILLKGQPTYITDGVHEAWNETGNPGMATGGTGDVLTGVITALLCQNLAPISAARLAAHVHGLAGDIAARQKGRVSLIASDVLDSLPDAFERLAHRA